MESQRTLSALRDISERFGLMATELAGRLGKKVRWNCDMPDLDVDSRASELLSLCLLHGLRNAMDHGIELPVQRTSSGKSEVGAVTLRARLCGARLEVELSDDGRGLSVAALANRSAGRSPYDAIFDPGVSTATGPSVLSGRGVGLDAVRAAVAAAGGSVGARAAKPSGFTLLASLPLEAIAFLAVPLKLSTGESVWWKPAQEGPPQGARPQGPSKRITLSWSQAKGGWADEAGAALLGEL